MQTNQVAFTASKLAIPPLRRCPWCGSAGILVRNSLGYGNGRGYPGCCEYYVRCSNLECIALAPNGTTTDIDKTEQEAIDLAVKRWNTRA